MLDAAGLSCVGQAPLFTLVNTVYAADLWRHLCQHGIVTRIFSDQPGRLRIGLPGNDAAWARLENALAHWQSRTPDIESRDRD
jgi:cobalamin biosynthetic protein CobC